MKERPILFRAEMVRAILEGPKTQTRRVVKPQPLSVVSADGHAPLKEVISQVPMWPMTGPGRDRCCPCPYGVPGDRLWVREGFAYTPKGTPFYRADFDHDKNLSVVGGWKPSIHMPRWASRITLEITDVRVQRVQEIGEEDAKAEGVLRLGATSPDLVSGNEGHEYRISFVELWDSINATRGFSWENNPWVWALTFRRVED
jgi:hypothetical protein